MTQKAATTIVAGMEKFEAVMIITATVAGSYYQELVKSKVPEPLAKQMVQDWHYIFWQNTLSEKSKPNIT